MLLKESVKDYEADSEDRLLRDLLLEELTASSTLSSSSEAFFSSASAADEMIHEMDDSAAAAAAAAADKESFATAMSKTVEEIGWIISNCDENDTDTTSAQDEFDRLMTLKQYAAMDLADNNPILTKMTSMAATVLDCEFCWILLMDLRVSWIISSVGTRKMTKGPRHLRIPCAHALNSVHPVMVVEDLSQDVRFHESDYVEDPFACRFYAAAPLVSPEGFRLGVFGVADRKAGPMSESKQTMLRDFADMTMQYLVERRVKLDLETKLRHAVACTSHDILTPLMGLQLSLGSLTAADNSLEQALSEKQRDLLSTAEACVTTMCQLGTTALQSVHDGLASAKKLEAFELDELSTTSRNDAKCRLVDLVDRLHLTLDPIDKSAPIIITLDKTAQASDIECDSNVFRAALAVLCLACARTKTGFTVLRIIREDRSLVFDFESTMQALTPDDKAFFVDSTVAIDRNGSTLPCLRLAAKAIRSLGGSCGDTLDDSPEQHTRLWFRVPYIQSTIAATNVISAVEEKESEEDGFVIRTGTEVTFHASMNPAARRKSLVNSPSVRHPSLPRIKKVLIIDDSLVVRKCLQRTLSTQFGYEVTLAEDGRNGLARLQETVFDFVLMDFLMPVMDGWDCTQQYRCWEASNRPWFRQHIIGMSAHAGTKDVRRAGDIGMDDFRCKPVTTQTLKDLSGDVTIIHIQKQLDYLLPIFCATTTATTDLVLNWPNGSVLCLSNDVAPLSVNSPRYSMERRKSEKHGQPERISSCLVCQSSAAKAAWSATTIAAFRKNGWVIETIQDSDEALSRLQHQNFDAVIVEDALLPLSGCQFISQFREWESKNRVHRQANVFLQLPVDSLVSRTLADGGSAFLQPPAGFDGIVGGSAVWDDFAYQAGVFQKSFGAAQAACLVALE